MQPDIPSAEQFHETGGLQNAMIIIQKRREWLLHDSVINNGNISIDEPERFGLTCILKASCQTTSGHVFLKAHASSQWVRLNHHDQKFGTSVLLLVVTCMIFRTRFLRQIEFGVLEWLS
jgi:hypothetical protein